MIFDPNVFQKQGKSKGPHGEFIDKVYKAPKGSEFPSSSLPEKYPMFIGKIKPRVVPEDIIINCSKDSKFPVAPEGHSWKEIRHDNTVTWLAHWTENHPAGPVDRYIWVKKFKSKNAEAEAVQQDEEETVEEIFPWNPNSLNNIRNSETTSEEK